VNQFFTWDRKSAHRVLRRGRFGKRSRKMMSKKSLVWFSGRRSFDVWNEMIAVTCSFSLTCHLHLISNSLVKYFKAAIIIATQRLHNIMWLSLWQCLDLFHDLYRGDLVQGQMSTGDWTELEKSLCNCYSSRYTENHEEKCSSDFACARQLTWCHTSFTCTFHTKILPEDTTFVDNDMRHIV